MVYLRKFGKAVRAVIETIMRIRHRGGPVLAERGGFIAGIVCVPTVWLLVGSLINCVRNRMSADPAPMPAFLWYGCWLTAVLISVLFAAGLRRLSRAGAADFMVATAFMAVLLLAFVALAATGFGPPD